VLQSGPSESEAPELKLLDELKRAIREGRPNPVPSLVGVSEDGPLPEHVSRPMFIGAAPKELSNSMIRKILVGISMAGFKVYADGDPSVQDIEEDNGETQTYLMIPIVLQPVDAVEALEGKPSVQA
jgi:hypothetical protein